MFKIKLNEQNKINFFKLILFNAATINLNKYKAGYGDDDYHDRWMNV